MSLAQSADSAVNLSPRQGLAPALRCAPALYATTLFVSALLLFAIQPMFTKMVLPKLGGASAVWSVAMVFFQAALLLGYTYAHLIARKLTAASSALVHLVVLTLAATTLPIGMAQGFGAAPQNGVELWLLALFAASIGLPFVALAASAPLLQNWFAATGHPHAGNPYVLYAASNLGSFAALVAYPFVIEPLFALRTQILAWSFGYAAFTLLLTAAAVVAAHTSAPSLRLPDRPTAAPGVAERIAWIALAAIPAGLVVAVTAVITTDVAAAPFLWVVPLALYLLTFVATFRERPWIAHRIILASVPFGAIAMIVTAFGQTRPYWVTMLALHLIGFAVLALACHGELYRRRPAPGRLTEFYLWTSFGGVLGGAFAGLLAPHAFNSTVEYPVLILAALIAMPGVFAAGARGFLRQAVPILIVAAMVAALVGLDVRVPAKATLFLYVALIILLGVMLLQRRQPVRFFSLALLAFVAAGLEPGLTRVEQIRSFFGVHRVVENFEQTHRLLLHGTTLHGGERVREPDGTPVTSRPEPLTYYYFGGPIGEAIAASRTAQGRLTRVAVIGLGTGSLACHRHDDETWTFFELDPHVVRIASNPRQFRFLSVCAPNAPIMVGDARLTLAASHERYDLIVLDAFSSDSIPVHLLTREAFAGYLSRLSAHGALVFHVSNRHMALQRPVAAVGNVEGLVAYGKTGYRQDKSEDEFRAEAEAVILARDLRDLADLPAQPGWRRIDPDHRVAAWTDDYADVLGAILDRKLRR